MSAVSSGPSWHPVGIGRRSYGHGSRRPVVGSVVAFDHAAWEVMHVIDRDPEGDEIEYLAGLKDRYRDDHMPYAVTLRRLHGPKHERENSSRDTGWRVGVGRMGWETYRDGRVPLCSCCQHPWPCRAQEMELFAERQMKDTERELRLLPGCCPACQEPISSRQKTIAFPGEYVHNPLAVPDPEFHTRGQCIGGARDYEEAWVAADPTRPRSLLTLSCDGHLTVHGDGAAECHGSTLDCPTVHAQHRSMSACWLLSLGCPRDCSRINHPGTRVANRPKGLRP